MCTPLSPTVSEMLPSLVRSRSRAEACVRSQRGREIVADSGAAGTHRRLKALSEQPGGMGRGVARVTPGPRSATQVPSGVQKAPWHGNRRRSLIGGLLAADRAAEDYHTRSRVFHRGAGGPS